MWVFHGNYASYSLKSRKERATARLKVLCESSSSLSFNNYHRQSCSLSNLNHAQSRGSLGGPYGLFGATSGTINDHYLFFTSHEIQKKKLVISTPCSNLWNNVFKTLKMKTLASSNFLNWKPKVLFLNGHNDLTNQTYNWIFLFQNCTHFSICRNFKEANYCMQFSPLFVCLSVCLSLLLFFDCFFCVQKLLLVRKEKLEP